jgi:hypothetical protein
VTPPDALIIAGNSACSAGQAGRYGDGSEAGEAAIAADPGDLLGPHGCRGPGRREGLQALSGRRAGLGLGRDRNQACAGIQPADIEELLAHEATTVVLSQGMNKQLQVPAATRHYLEQRAVTVHVAETREAVKIYNNLADDALVAGLFHSTC